jgi:hypothetical protein
MSIVVRSMCCVLLALLAVAVHSAPAPAYLAGIYWDNEQCLQTGQLGSESFACENAAEPNYLSTHMVNNLSGIEDYKLPTGQYCSYTGINDTLDLHEETPYFGPIPSPAGDYQRGDGKRNVCAAWALPERPLRWGLQLHNSGDEGACSDVDPDHRCGMERYMSLGEGLEDRPWAAYFGDPRLAVYDNIEPLLFSPGGGGGWGYLCVVLEAQGSGNILELCNDQWHGEDGQEWVHAGVHVEECRGAGSGFDHNVDKIVFSEDSENEWSGFLHEPIEGEHETLAEPWYISGFRLQGFVEDDDKPFVAKEHSEEDPGERASEPELGAGCGRSSSTAPSEWALIGISNGIEQWLGEPNETRTKLNGLAVQTVFEPQPIEISTQQPTDVTESKATLSGTVDPYGFATKYVIEYGKDSPEHETAPSKLSGRGVTPVPDTATLTGLSPHATYDYRIRAFHEEAGAQFDVTYGPVQELTTAGAQCSGIGIGGQGATLQRWSRRMSGSQASTNRPPRLLATVPRAAAANLW